MSAAKRRRTSPTLRELADPKYRQRLVKDKKKESKKNPPVEGD